MTREQFLSGVSFKVKGPSYKGAETFYYDECIMKESRSSLDERVIYKGHHANVLKVGRVGFIAFTFVMNKKVVVKYRFEDLVEFIREA
jgi:hypothetical protein